MNLVTYSAIKTKIENDLDLIDETFISETELLGYMNEAINDAQAVIHNLGLEARYFLTQDTLTISNGTSDYSMPTDIYANKIVHIQYTNGSKTYYLRRIREMGEIPFIEVAEDYKYQIFNLTAGIVMRLFPTPVESGAFITRYYIREVRALTTSTDASNTCEIPECINFLYQHVKTRCYEKEGNKNLEKAVMDLKTQHDLMVQTLQEMVPDTNNQILPDFSHYEDMALEWGWRV